MSAIRVCEIFGPTIQGEGALVGHVTVFVRTGGCDFRCSWCDSLYAVLPEHRGEWQPLDAAGVLERVEALSGGHPILITLSGGNPALQPLDELLELGRARGHRFALETQGTRAPEWLARLDHLVLSPKPPSSGMEFSAVELDHCFEAAHGGDGARPSISLKVVVFDEADFLFARRVHQGWAQRADAGFFLSVGNSNPDPQAQIEPAELTGRLEWLLERCTLEGWFEPILLPQLHVLLWGNKRGV